MARYVRHKNPKSEGKLLIPAKFRSAESPDRSMGLSIRDKNGGRYEYLFAVQVPRITQPLTIRFSKIFSDSLFPF